MELILIRGTPGSGKSTLAKSFAKKFGYEHIEADMFFMVDGEYQFDANHLHTAHEWCKEVVNTKLHYNTSVVVSNTFTTIKELRPYFEIAKEYNIVPTVILCQNQYGSVHNVPEETMLKMKKRFVYDLTPLFEEYKNDK